MARTLADLVSTHGVSVAAHLDQQAAIPVLAELQCQGDLAIVPFTLIEDQVSLLPDAYWRSVPAEGIEVVRGTAMGNAHTLLASPDTCMWTHQVTDVEELAIGVLEATAAVYLAHPEHGYAGIAPGRYVIRRQREQREIIELVED